MKRLNLIILSAFIFSIILCIPLLAQQKPPIKYPRKTIEPQPFTQIPKEVNYVELVVLSNKTGDTSNPNEIMYSLEVQFTNKTKKAIQITNNDLFLIEKSGKRHAVNRLRFAEAIFLEPEKPTSCDRIYFTIPRDAKIRYLVLYKKGIVAGKTTF